MLLLLFLFLFLLLLLLLLLFSQGLGPYSVSKTALLGLAKVLARELGDDNITVNCLAPGIVDTRFSSAVSRYRRCYSPFQNYRRVGFLKYFKFGWNFLRILFGILLRSAPQLLSYYSF